VTTIFHCFEQQKCQKINTKIEHKAQNFAAFVINPGVVSTIFWWAH